jgi:hypothetical protein
MINCNYLRKNCERHGHEVLYCMKIEFLILSYLYQMSGTWSDTKCDFSPPGCKK